MPENSFGKYELIDNVFNFNSADYAGAVLIGVRANYSVSVVENLFQSKKFLHRFESNSLHFTNWNSLILIIHSVVYFVNSYRSCFHQKSI